MLKTTTQHKLWKAQNVHQTLKTVNVQKLNYQNNGYMGSSTESLITNIII